MVGCVGVWGVVVVVLCCAVLCDIVCSLVGCVWHVVVWCWLGLGVLVVVV